MMAAKGVVWIIAVLFCAALPQVNGFNLTILHTNDVHARIQEVDKHNGGCSASKAAEGKCYGGLERMKTKIDELRNYYTNTLLLDAGDQYQGTLFFFAYGGQIMSHFMNLLGYNAMALGNHEFDMGPSGLKPFLDNSTAHILSSNIDFTETPELSAVKKSVVLDVSGQKIGIVGYTTTSTPIVSKPGKAKFHDEIESVRAEVNKLTSQGVNKIIALGHSGYDKDMEIARKVAGVDIVIGGHTNTFLYTGKAPGFETPMGEYPTVIKNVDGSDVLVVQDYAYTKYLGFLRVLFDDQGKLYGWSGNPIFLDNSIPKDKEVTALIEAYLPRVEQLKTEKVGVSLVRLDGERRPCRLYECNMGNMVTDAMLRQNLRYADGLQWNHISVAILNTGAIRASIPRGEITTSDVLAVMPYSNTFDIVTLPGSALMEALEHSVAEWTLDPLADLSGQFLQMSGMRVVYDTRRDLGKRVIKAEIACSDCDIPLYEPLNTTRLYKVLMSSFMVGGGDGFTMLKDNIVGGSHTIGDVDSQLLLDYVKENSPIAKGLEGRIQFLQDIDDSTLCVDSSSTLQSSLFLLIATLSAYLVLF